MARISSVSWISGWLTIVPNRTKIRGHQICGCFLSPPPTSLTMLLDVSDQLSDFYPTALYPLLLLLHFQVLEFLFCPVICFELGVGRLCCSLHASIARRLSVTFKSHFSLGSISLDNFCKHFTYSWLAPAPVPSLCSIKLSSKDTFRVKRDRKYRGCFWANLPSSSWKYCITQQSGDE